MFHLANRELKFFLAQLRICFVFVDLKNIQEENWLYELCDLVEMITEMCQFDR